MRDSCIRSCVREENWGHKIGGKGVDVTPPPSTPPPPTHTHILACLVLVCPFLAKTYARLTPATVQLGASRVKPMYTDTSRGEAGCRPVADPGGWPVKKRWPPHPAAYISCFLAPPLRNFWIRYWCRPKLCIFRKY